MRIVVYCVKQHNSEMKDRALHSVIHNRFSVVSPIKQASLICYLLFHYICIAVGLAAPAMEQDPHWTRPLYKHRTKTWPLPLAGSNQSKRPTNKQIKPRHRDEQNTGPVPSEISPES